MDPKLEQKLYDKYPAFFRQHSLSMQETCMCWGLPGPGWFKIIDTMAKKLTAYAEKHNIILEATQVKEKYGQLTVYLNQSNSEIDAIVQKAEQASLKTCEICGKPGSINKGPWYSVRCPKCRAKEAKRCKI
jgi:GH35 family endo-1,4-beta-xylanase